jgi:hypothetical protein
LGLTGNFFSYQRMHNVFQSSLGSNVVIDQMAHFLSVQCAIFTQDFRTEGGFEWRNCGSIGRRRFSGDSICINHAGATFRQQGGDSAFATPDSPR